MTGLMESTYYNIMGSVERSYRLFLELIKKRLEQIPAYDINNVQAMMIYNIADQEVSVGEITSRGMYQGSNVSYNLKKLIQMGYIVQSPSPHDRRSFYVRLSAKGLGMFKVIDNFIHEQDLDIAKFFPNKKSVGTISQNLESLEGFLRYQSVKK